jgi:hypothetical protein
MRKRVVLMGVCVALLAQAGVGFSATNVGQGQLWLQNQNGVKLHLWTTQQGLALSVGADGIVVNVQQ